MDILQDLANIRREISALKANKRINFEQLSYTQKSTRFTALANGYYTVTATCTPLSSDRMPVVDYSLRYVASVYPQSEQWYVSGERLNLEVILTASNVNADIDFTVCGFNLKDVSFRVSKTG